MQLPPLEQLAHATLITGNVSKNIDLVKKYIADQSVIIEGNPDVSLFQGEQLLMTTAESIIELSHQKKTGSARYFIIAFHRMASDVQNKLLKTLEEPQESVYFLLIFPSTQQLLDTLLSRVRVIEGNQDVGLSRLEAAEFLGKNLKERFELIETWTKNKKDENNLDKSEVIAFCDRLEKKIWDKLKNNPTPVIPKEEGAERLFADIRNVRNYASIRGASHRVLLDFLAMRCPILK